MWTAEQGDSIRGTGAAAPERGRSHSSQDESAPTKGSTPTAPQRDRESYAASPASLHALLVRTAACTVPMHKQMLPPEKRETLAGSIGPKSARQEPQKHFVQVSKDGPHSAGERVANAPTDAAPPVNQAPGPPHSKRIGWQEARPRRAPAFAMGSWLNRRPDACVLRHTPCTP